MYNFCVNTSDINSNDMAFYGKYLPIMEEATDKLTASVDLVRKMLKSSYRRDYIEYCTTRIKSSESMKAKLEARGYEPTLENAMHRVRDAVGIRIICKYADDVYTVANMLRNLGGMNVVREKDYIGNPKPNGYRSYHMIVQFPVGANLVFAEIQIRTIAMDCWASLEHGLRYKNDSSEVEMLSAELKRCADEMASTDLNLQTIRDLVFGADKRKAEEIS